MTDEGASLMAAEMGAELPAMEGTSLMAAEMSAEPPAMEAERRRCGAKSRRTGQPCRCYSMHGQQRCRMHGGSTGVALRAAERRLAIAKVGSMLGIPKDVDPADALLDAVRLAAGDTEYLRVQVQALEAGPVTVTPYGDGVHPLVKLYHESLKRQGEMASLAIKAGIEERRVRLAESASVRLAQIIVAVLDSRELQLTAHQRSAGRELAHRLMTNRPVGDVI